MLQFPLNSDPLFPWHKVPSMAEPLRVLHAISIVHIALQFSTSIAVLAFYGCLAWIAAIVGAAIW